jgi:hypothetical protein
LGFADYADAVSFLSIKLNRKVSSGIPSKIFLSSISFGDDSPHISTIIPHPFLAELRSHFGIGDLRN